MIVNLTSHVIDVYAAADPGVVGWHTPILSIAPEPAPARLTEAVVNTSRVLSGAGPLDVPVNVALVEYGHAVNLPDPTPGTWFVVNLVVALALPGRRDLLVPYRQVRNVAGAVVGCRGFARPAPVG